VDIPIFRIRRRIGEPRTETGECPDGPLLAVAGIAAPAAFFEDLRASGFSLAGTLAFSDHHPFSTRDLQRIEHEARARGAAAVVTTEKDYVRLLPLRPFAVPVAWVPLTIEPEPLDEFAAWLAGGLRAARDIVATA
jgi:tetraacyldisaccharide 4'-kinase